MTTTFTTENTEGFTPAELAVLNEAFDALYAPQGDDLDAERAKSLVDALTNVWCEGYTVAELIGAAERRLAYGI